MAELSHQRAIYQRDRRHGPRRWRSWASPPCVTSSAISPAPTRTGPLTRPIRDLTEGGERLCPSHDRRRSHCPPHPRRPHHRPNPCRGRDRSAGHCVLQSGVPEKQPPPGEIFIFYGKVEGQRRHQLVNPLLEPGGPPAADGAHHAHLPTDGGHQPADADAGGAAGAGRCRELLPDVLPDAVRREHRLCYINSRLRKRPFS